MSIDDMINVFRAAKDGKQIQVRRAGSQDRWINISDPVWNFEFMDYRAKPEPREWLVHVKLDGSIEQPGTGTRCPNCIKVCEALE